MMRTAEAAGSDRSRTGVLAYAILGLLAAEPLTGYQLAQRMRAPIGYMWTAAHSQIYPELAKLLADGQVRAAVIPGRGPRDTKRYTITTAGRRALRDWVDSPADRGGSIRVAASRPLALAHFSWSGPARSSSNSERYTRNGSRSTPRRSWPSRRWPPTSSIPRRRLLRHTPLCTLGSGESATPSSGVTGC